MADYDIFNGDADGICALVQLRLDEPRTAVLVTGVKRDIELLQQVVPAAGDRLTVLDISMDKNRAPLERALLSGAEVFYVDHHQAGEIPSHAGLRAIINEAPEVCTSLLINSHLDGRHAGWAVVGAFGDNLNRSATTVAKTLTLSEGELTQLENLGNYINYNGYGANEEDLHFAPAELFRQVLPYADPLEFIRGAPHTFQKLEQGFKDDMGAAAALEPLHAEAKTAVFLLPDAPWARRVSGVFSNDLTNQFPERAHAVVTEKANGNYLVSVRAPLNDKRGAVDLCRQFPTGGGRAAAAGINDLPEDMLSQFIDAFRASYG